MTTVAYANGMLATDSRATGSAGIIQANFKKLYTPEEGKRWSIHGKRILAIGVAGEAHGIYELLAHLEKGITFETKGKQDAWTSCIAVADDKTIFVVDGYGDRKNTLFVNLPADVKYAMGSGGEIATAYLTIGKKPNDAVKAAIKLDQNSGGDIQVWEFPEVLPEDVAPVEQTKDQKDLITKVAGQLEQIRASALEKATAEIIAQTSPAEPAKAKA